MGAIQSNRKPSYDVNGEGKIFFVSLFEQYNFDQVCIFVFIAVNFDHFQILRAIGKGAFGKVKDEIQTAIWLPILILILISFNIVGVHCSKERHKGYVCNEVYE